MVVAPAEAREWSRMSLHAHAQSYFEPYRGIGLLANFLESLAATKELVFALAAGFYLAWSWRLRWNAREREREVQEQKDYLDTFLDETIRVEKAQMETEDPVELKSYLDEVTRIKLKALEELSHEDLRGDRTFLIFLTQCANLIAKIQSKIDVARSGPVRK